MSVCPAHLLPVLAPAAVQALDDAGGVPEDQGEAGGARDHGHHRQPEVRHVLWRESVMAAFRFFSLSEITITTFRSRYTACATSP